MQDLMFQILWSIMSMACDIGSQQQKLLSEFSVFRAGLTQNSVQSFYRTQSIISVKR